jgi:hypothetical protein
MFPSPRKVSRVVAAFIAVSCGVTGLLAAPHQAAAQPAADKTREADALFTKGKELMAAGKLAEGCTAFERSQAIDPKVTTLVNLANCREKNGQLATASRLFVEAAEQLSTSAAPGSTELRQLSSDRAAALAPRLSRLTLRVTGAPEGLKVWRGREAISATQWNQPLAVDGGTYELSARAPGTEPWSTTITVSPEGDQQTVDVPALTPEAAAPEPPAQPEPPPARGGSMALPVGLGLGAVLLGGGAIAIDLSAQSLNDEAQDMTSRLTLAERDEKWRSANTRRYTAVAVGVAAVGCAGAAVYFYFHNRKRQSDEQSAPATSLAPMFAPSASGGIAGMQLEGSW